MKELSLRESSERPAEAKELANIPQPSLPRAAVKPEEITEPSPIKVLQLVTRDDVVSQTILHYTTPSPSGKDIIINN